MAQRNNSKKKNNTLFTAACVLLGLLIIFIIFIVNKDQIFTNLKETKFFDKLFGSTPTFVENHEPAESKKTDAIPLKEDVTIQIQEENQEQTAPVSINDLKGEDNQSEQEKNKSDKSETQQKTTEKNEENEPGKNTEKKDEKKVDTKKIATSEVQLCFIIITGDGLITRQIVKRSVKKSDSPLTNAINLLLQGPDTTLSAEKNCMTLIPRGAKLLNARVSDGIAYLNFNEAFEINTDGAEGYNHQLEQIVFTATSFSTVNSVQFLIEGKKLEYLGSEGVWIGSPLSRSQF